MKRYLLCLLTIAAIVACSKGEDEGKGSSNPSPDKSKTEIKIETPTADFSTEGGSNTISFTSSEAWTAQVINSRADEWISIHPTSGDAGDATITVTTQPNDTPDNRTATIVIKAGAVSKNITVSQKQKDALTVTASKFEVAAEGGEVKIEVKANINFEYTIEESAKDWIKYESTRALKTSTLTFSVAENGDFEKREAKIYITSGEFNEAITIYQEGSEPSIVISKNEYVVSADGETIAVTVKSNVDVAVELSTDVNWVTENTTRGVSTNTYYFDIAPSEEYDQRTAEILFTNKENNLSEVVTIVQTQRDAIVVAKESYTVDSEGDQIQIEVGYNVDFDVEISSDWITRVESRTFTTDVLTFNIAANPTNDNREGTITFKSNDGNLSQTVKVYQVQDDALVISKKDIVVSADSGTVSFEIQANVDFKVSEPNVSWLRAVQTRGLTTHTLHYEYDANTSYDSREAQIVVTDTKNNKSETITITQSQKDAIVLAKDSYAVESEGGQIQIEVGHNIDFNIEISSDWITRVESRTFTTDVLTFNIAANPTNDNREGTITFKSNDGKLSQTVKVYQVQDDALIISKKDIVVSADSGTVSFEIQSNVDFKVSEPNVSWLRAVQTRGLTTHTLHYEYDANTSYDSREAQIVVTDTKNNKSETITITQSQKDAIVLAKDSYAVESEGGQIQIEVGHNIDFNIEISSDWITRVESRTFTTDVLTFNIAANPTNDNREGTITFKSNDGKLSQTVKVYQVQDDALIISKKDIVVSADSGTVSFEIQSNVDFKVSEPNVSWLRAVQTRGLTTHTLHYEYDANTSYDSRKAQIVVTDTKNNKSETITITQAQKDAIVLAKDSYAVESEGGQIQIEVGHNIDFNIEISSDWITRVESRTFTTDVLTFNIAANPTNDNREGTITFKSNDGKLSQTIKVCQAQTDALIISEKDIIVSSDSGTISFEIQANVDFKVSEPNVSWLRAVQTRGLTTHTLHYEYDANTSHDSREAQIVVTDTKNNKSETITITQSQKDAIVLAKDSYAVESEGGQIQIEVGHNIDFNIEISSDWITRVESRTFTTDVLTFNIAANPTNDNREGSITFKSKDGKLSQTVKVYQDKDSNFKIDIDGWDSDDGDYGGSAE